MNAGLRMNIVCILEAIGGLSYRNSTFMCDFVKPAVVRLARQQGVKCKNYLLWRKTVK